MRTEDEAVANVTLFAGTAWEAAASQPGTTCSSYNMLVLLLHSSHPVLDEAWPPVIGSAAQTLKQQAEKRAEIRCRCLLTSTARSPHRES